MQILKSHPDTIKLEPQSRTETMRDMTQTISFMVGALLISIGLCEIVVPQFIDMDLSILHSVLIAAAGSSLLYNAYKVNTHAAYLTCLISGLAFLVLSLLGFGFGEPTTAFLRYDRADAHMIDFIPGFNALGTFDHGVHAVLGVALLLGAYDWYRHHKVDTHV